MQQGGTNNSRFVRTAIQAGLFALVIVVFWGADTLAKRNVRLVDGIGLDDFRLYTEQVTSGLTVWLLIPAVAWWLRHFPLQRDRVWSAIAGHTIGSALFATCHFFIMIGMRVVIHRLNDMQYNFSEFWVRNLLIEWQKDLKIYVAIVGILMAFRYFHSRSDTTKVGDGRLAVQSRSGEHLVSYPDIECFEASRNYVSVHTEEREYLLRQTIARLEEGLADRRFVRTHRSFIVNQDMVVGIEPKAGGYELLLTSGRRVPLSRSRRDEVRRLLGL